MPFPPMDAFGGLINARRSVADRRVELRKSATLSELNQGPGRIVDSFWQDYARLVRDDPAPFAELDPRQKDTSVAIIGAGISGLCALYELVRCGLQPDLYEVRDNIGGRLDSKVFDDPDKKGTYVAEMGAMRFPDTSKLLWHYLHEALRILGMPDDPELKIFPNPGKVVTALNVEGQTNLWKSDPTKEGFGLPPRVQKLKDDFLEALDEHTTFTVEGYMVGLGQVADLLKLEELPPLERRLIRGYWAQVIETFDGYSLERFLREKMTRSPYSWQERDFRLFAAVGMGTGGFGQDYPTAFIDFLRYDTWAYEALYQLPYSSNDIAQLMMKAIRKIGWTGKLVTAPVFAVVRATGWKGKIGVLSPNPEDYDFAIVATGNVSMITPMLLGANEALDSIEVLHGVFACENDPAVPTSTWCYSIRQSLRNLTAYPSTKIWQLAKKPFADPDWPTLGGEPLRWILTDREAGQTAWFDPYPEDPAAYTPLLVTYQNGFDATRYGGFREGVQIGMTVGSQLMRDYWGMKLEGSQKEIGKPLEIVTAAGRTDQEFQVDWHNEPFINGGFRLALPGQYHYNAALAFQYLAAADERIDDAYKRVFLAGEYAFFLDGWVEGPMHAAVNAASAVLHRITDGNTRMGAILSQDMWQFGRTDTAFWDDRMNTETGVRRSLRKGEDAGRQR
jgi:hypothetical protein